MICVVSFVVTILVKEGAVLSRLSWNQYFLEIAKLASKRSTCLRRQYGAVIVKDKAIIATGYNGVASGCTHCDKLGCLREELNVPQGQRYELCRSTHAEQNAICQAAKHGTSINGATMYVTGLPCNICAKLIINSGIKKVVCYDNSVLDAMTKDLFKEAEVELQLIK